MNIVFEQILMDLNRPQVWRLIKKIYPLPYNIPKHQNIKYTIMFYA